MNEANYFRALYAIDVNEYVEKKGNLSYLSWPWAWAMIKKAHPDAFYTIYENRDGWNYHTDGRTAWVKTGLTINGLEHIEYLPVMNNTNRSIPVNNITSFDVNKAIQRSLTKAAARHGLGLYIYAGEDLPEEEKKEEPKPPVEKPRNFPQAEKKPEPLKCSGDKCGAEIIEPKNGAGQIMSPTEWEKMSRVYYGRVLCPKCMKSGKYKRITVNVDE